MSSASGHPLVSIIIVNWNSYKELCACLSSLDANVRGVPYEVIVIDNNSSERDIDDLTQLWPHITLIKSSENLGFGKANNSAVARSRGSILTFLNPDTVVPPGSLERLCEYLLTHSRAGIVGPKLTGTDGNIQRDCARRRPTLRSTVFNIMGITSLFGHPYWASEYLADYMRDQSAEFISGGCLVIRKDVFQEVGGFSAPYFMYGEDADLCFKCRKRGYRNRYLASAEVVHRGGASSAKTKNAKIFEHWHFKSRREFFKNHGRPAFLLLNIFYIIGSALRVSAAEALRFSFSLAGNTAQERRYWAIREKYRKIFLLPFNPGA